METIGDDEPEGGAHMLSFNHYAYGAVVEWIVTTVGGLAPAPDGPGYRRATVGPRPSLDVTSAETAIETPYGTLALDWEIDGGDFAAELAVPFGVTAILDLPTQPDSAVTVDGATLTGNTLGPGRHHVRVTNARVARGAER
jgi:alpha-L-rhamnosidase